MLKTDPSTWTDRRHRMGASAEQEAARLLTSQGYEILERRFRFHRHDVDLVARRGSIVVFLEVKARLNDDFGSPLESVTAVKQSRIARAAAAWLQRFGRPGDVCRFDVVALQGDRVEWLQSAFRPGWR